MARDEIEQLSQIGIMDETEEPIACSHAEVFASFSFCRLLPVDIFISSLLHRSLSFYLP
jgi:hypothetical protein